MQNHPVRKFNSIADQFRTGKEWQPGRPAPKRSNRNEVAQPADDVKVKVSEALKEFFLREQPPADDVVVLPDSLRLVDTAHDIWVANVQTTIHFRKLGARHHVSRVRFRITQAKPGNDSRFCIFHNHVIFV